MTFRNLIRTSAIILVGFYLLGILPLKAADTFVFQPIAKRDNARDWKAEFKVSDGLHNALQAYELNPATDTAIGVLKHFNEFYKMDSDSRAKILRTDNAVFQSVDFMKYELVMQTRKRLSANGAVASRRVGSSGAREAAIINWVKGGRAGDPPAMDPEKQFKSDDDVTNFVSERLAETNPTAHEEVNGSRAIEAYQAVVAEFGYKETFHPSDAQTEFLSPTKAWAVIAAKEQLNPREMPSFMFEWVRMNPEKYNNQYAVEMLEIWGYDKGWLTRDVTDPMNTTVAMKDAVSERPQWPSSASEFAYIADNYRQIYDVHHGKFQSECKYLVRMIDAWEARSGPDSLPPGWEQIRATANNLYLNGVPGEPKGEVAAFRSEIGNHISSVVQQAHEYHLDRVAAAIQAAMEKLAPKEAAKVTMEELVKVHPELDVELNLLSVGYTNIPDEVRQKLLDQFRKRIRDGEASSDYAEIYRSQVFTHIMAATQERVTYSRAQTQAFTQVRNRIEARLNEHLKATDLDAFVEEVAKGKFTTPQYRLVGDEVRLVNRQMDPESVLRDIKLIDAVSTLFRYDNQKYTQWVREYFDSGDPGMSISILRSMHELFDTSRTRPLYVQYKDTDGKLVTQQIPVSGTSLGAVLFKAAGKGADIFGQVQSGRDLYDRLVKLHQGGLSQAELGEAYATILNSYVGLHELVKKEKWFTIHGANLIGQFALGSPGGISAGGSAGAEAARDLAWAAFKDIAAIWMPNVAIAIGLAEMTSWGWNLYTTYSSRNQIITAMLENGVWKPATPAGLKDLASGELPKLYGVREKEGGAANPVEMLARLGFKMELIESKTELTPREVILDLAHDGGYIGKDPAIQVDIDAINSAAGPWIQMFRLGALPANARKWTQENMRSLGLLFNKNEDSLVASRATEISVDPSIRSSWSGLWLWNADLPDTQLRIIGYIMSDFWAKRQIVMEQAMLPELIKEASRQWLDKLKSKDVTKGNYEFTKEIELIDERVKGIDKKLWPRIARSADPFSGPDYDAEKDTPILKAFQNETDQLRTDLKRFEQFLKDPNQTTLNVPELRPPRGGRVDIKPPGATKDKVAELAAKKLQQMRDSYYRYLDGYDQVHGILDQGNQRVAEGSVKIEPFHLRLDPAGWALLAIGEGISNPARGPIYDTK